MKISKRHKENISLFNKEKKYTLNEGVSFIKRFKKAKFNETIDIAMRLGIDPKQADQQIRGSVSLPYGTGKPKKVIAFARGEKAEEARANGADRVGSDDLVAEIEKGWMDFDVAVATPDMMPLVGKLGRLLGPQGKMPSPKSGTVTEHVGNTVKDYKAGRIEYRNDNAGNLHAPVGQMSFSDEHILENIQTFIDHIRTLKPASSKGLFINAVTISSTMGPGIKLAIGE